MVNKNIPNPSPKEVEYYLEQWNLLEDYALQENSLEKLFLRTYPVNNEMDDVLIKVCALNQFYSTNIRRIFDIAKHIVSLDIDKDLKDKKIDLVDRIAKGHGIHTSKKTKESHLYSFATKYCSHHNSAFYPIYDSFVEKLLIYFNKKDNFHNFKREDLRSYELFKKTLEALRKHYGLEAYTLKQIDKYLWQAGKKYFPKKY